MTMKNKKLDIMKDNNEDIIEDVSFKVGSINFKMTHTKSVYDALSK